MYIDSIQSGPCSGAVLSPVPSVGLLGTHFLRLLVSASKFKNAL